MAFAIAGLHVFAADVGPEALSLLDGNFTPLLTALNTPAGFSNNYIDSGAVNGLVVTIAAPQVFTAYTDGVILQVKVAVTNTTTTPTLNVNALGAKPIVNPDGSPIAVGALAGGGWAVFQYEATTGKWMLIGGAVAAAFSTGFFGDGSAANPSITFTADTNTGIYRPGADTWAVATGGVQRAQVGAAGNWLFDSPSAGSTVQVNSGTPAATNLASTLQVVSNTTPGYGWGSTGAGTDLKNWDAFADASGNLNFRAINDANNTALLWAQVNGRAGVTAATLQTIDDAGALQTVGWRDLPQNAQAGNYTTVLADRGKSVVLNGTGAGTFTIAANASVAYLKGTVIAFANRNSGAANLTITIGGTDTLVLAGVGSVGARTLAPNGMCSALKTDATVWLISGPGLT